MKIYLALKSVAAIGGSWFVNKKQIAAHDWKATNQLTRESLKDARGYETGSNLRKSVFRR